MAAPQCPAAGRKFSYVANQAAGRQARAAALRASAASGQPTPGAYMKERRRAAGMTREQVAAKVAAHFGARGYVETQIEDLERDQPGDHSRLIRTLKAHNAFPFNIATFFALAAATCAPALGEWEPA